MSHIKIVEMGMEASKEKVTKGGIKKSATEGNTDTAPKEKRLKGGVELIGLKSFTEGNRDPFFKEKVPKGGIELIGLKFVTGGNADSNESSIP